MKHTAAWSRATALRCCVRLSLLAVSLATLAQTATLHIEPSAVVAPVSPTLYGLMTEEINHSYEGGLYAEQLQNRTFRSGWRGMDPWTVVQHGSAHATLVPDKSAGPSAALTNSAKLTVTAATPGNEAGLGNTGWWGIAVHPGEVFRGSFYAKTGGAQRAFAQLVNDHTGAVIASAPLSLRAGAWSRYAYTLKAGSAPATADVHFELLFTSPGTVWLQLVSLMPPTYAGRANGNRIDLMEKLAALHPTFLRLPGGNYLEGDTLADWYNWRKTNGPLVDRPGHQAPWTYWSTDGLGLLEYLEWCEDLHIEPVLAVYAGYALNHTHVEPGPPLQPYVDAAVDEIEYVTGDASTHWGAQRARDGHPQPFPLHYVEIGNEDNFDTSGSYPARFAQIAGELRQHYPRLKLIATDPVNEDAAHAPDLLDEHYYKPLDDMLAFAHHYDGVPRDGRRIFVGEWATLEGTPTSDFGAALGDAAFMTGLERNSDIVLLSAYAPLFTNVNPGASQWTPDLIGFDALHSYGSPSYWAQVLFARHLGDGIAKTQLTAAGPRFFQSATVDTQTHTLHLKLVNAADAPEPLEISWPGMRTVIAQLNTLHASTLEDTNSITAPNRIRPVATRQHITPANGSWHHTVPPLTIEVLDIPLR